MKKFDLTFGEAIEALKKGQPVYRQGWNGKGLFVFRQVPAEIDLKIVPNMQSLPESVKDIFISRQTRSMNDPWNVISYSSQLALVNKNNMITGWSPSTSDALAVDWCIYTK